MMIHGTADVRPVLDSTTIAVIGYGSQGRAHALNLRDSGHRVLVGTRPSASRDLATADGFDALTPADAVAQAGLVALLVPDTSQPAVWNTDVAPHLQSGTTVLFAHGFSVHFHQVVPPADVNVVLVAPKGPGNLVREQFVAGRGVPALLAVEQDATGDAADVALAYAHGIGATRAGVLRTTFAEETETDLFGEQAVLCGGVTALMLAGYETLVEAGYQPEVAYFECIHELKLIVDLLHTGGLQRMYRFVSDTAGYGALTRGREVVGDDARCAMRDILQRIQDGRFASEWVGEHAVGQPHFRASMRRELTHPVEAVGASLRARMPWLDPQPAQPAQPTTPATARTAPQEVRS